MRINTGDIRPFVPIAAYARKCDVMELVRSTVLPGNYVINLKRSRM
jgi:hypothetical protein